MIQVTMNDFAANLTEYIENVRNQKIVITKEDGEKLAVLTVHEEKGWFENWIETAGEFDFSNPVEFKRFKTERLKAKYESLD